MSRRSTPQRIALSAICLGAFAASASAQMDKELPCTADRWHYPFAFSPPPATRPTATLFAAPPASGFDYRDGQMLLRISPITTPGDPNYVPDGGDPTRYGFTGARLIIYHTPGNYSWDTRTPVLNSSGQPFAIELWGMGVDSDLAPLTPDTWLETTAFQGQSSGVVSPPGQRRNPHPLHIDPAATDTNVSNDTTAVPWAIGLPVYGTGVGEYEPNTAVADPFPLTFTLDVNNPRIRTYIQEGLASSGIEFVVTSTGEPAGMGADPITPVVATRENTTAPAPMLVLEGFTLPSSVDSWSLYQ